MGVLDVGFEESITYDEMMRREALSEYQNFDFNKLRFLGAFEKLPDPTHSTEGQMCTIIKNGAPHGTYVLLVVNNTKIWYDIGISIGIKYDTNNI